MTELQLGLIGLGATAVVGVFAYNKWQEYRHRKVAESVLKPNHEDVLLDGAARQSARAQAAERSEPVLAPAESESFERVEPGLGADETVMVEEEITWEDDETPAAAVTEEHVPTPAPAPVAEPEPRKAIRASAPPAEAAPPAATVYAPAPAPVAVPITDSDIGEAPAELLDPRLEFIVAMELVEPVAAYQILHSQRDVLRRLSKPVHWVAYNERAREWQRLTAESDLPLRRLRVGLQLVNRLGPVSETDVATFVGAMNALADELMAVADMPSSRVLDQAAEIDRFCAAVDLEIGLNLVSRGNAFTGTKIRALAEAAGMSLNGDGLFTRYDENGCAQFSLQNFESTLLSAESLRQLSTHGLTFLLDVPRVSHGERVFSQMTEIARRFADTLQGALVDDNRQPLSEAQLEHIRREFIGKPQATMASFGLPAGSAQALRLFS